MDDHQYNSPTCDCHKAVDSPLPGVIFASRHRVAGTVVLIAGIRVSRGEILISDSQPRRRCRPAARGRDKYDRSPD